jgi:eukaryotic-like serine/threonine-protein kinase
VPAGQPNVAAAPRGRAAGRRRGLGAAAVALVVVAAALATGVLSGVVPLPGWSGPRPAVTAGPTRPASPSPTVSPVPTILPGTAAVVSDPLTSVGLWRVRDDTQAHGTTCAFAGALVVTRRSAGSYRCPGPQLSYTDFSVSVNIKLLTPGSCAAVWFRFDDGGYALRLCPTGYALVSHGATDANSVITLRTFRFDEQVPLRRATKVGISARGRTLSFYRDGTHVGTVTDGTFQRGRVVLGILQEPTPHQPPYRVSFSGIDVWARYP